MFVDSHVQRRLRVQRRIVGTKYRNTLGKFGVVSHLPGIGTGSVTERLGFGTAISVLVITYTRTEFKTEAVYRTVQELATITGGEDIALAITVVTVS